MKKEESNWMKIIARDLIAIGGIPFFILVLVRVYLLNNPDYFLQFVVAGIIFIALFLLLKQNIYAGLGLIVLTFTSLYYEDFIFSAFGTGAYVLLLVSLIYLKEDLWKIILGVILGSLSIGVTFLI